MKRAVQKSIRDSLTKKHVCYVLITCDPPSEDGEMQVEMTYEGDATLAAYLLQGAKFFIDEQELDQDFNDKQVICSSKICYFE